MKATTTNKNGVVEALKAVADRVVPAKMTAAVLYGSGDLRIEK
jgi:hypothetical protein